MPRGFLQVLPSGPLVELTHERTRIGRGRHCEFPVESKTLSREHSVVERRAEGFWLQDLGSSYGTWVARAGGKPQRIPAPGAWLENGDVIDLQNPIRFTLTPD